jgi:hypothetical protein
MLILFDHGAPRGLARALAGHTVITAKARGWDRLNNGALLRAAEAAAPDSDRAVDVWKCVIMAIGKASYGLDRGGSRFFLTGVPECDPGDLARLVEPLGLKGSITTRYALAESEIRRLVLERGISYLWRRVKLQEDILPRTADLPALLAVLENMLRRIAPTEELIVVDRYLLPKACPDCLDNLTFLISPILNGVSRVVLVTRKEYDEALLNDLRAAFKKRRCEVLHRISDNFHDRFWIADHARGLFVGTSPNGLGKRYALADYMAEDDVRTIVEALSGEGLLPERNARGEPPTIAA